MRYLLITLVLLVGFAFSGDTSTACADGNTCCPGPPPRCFYPTTHPAYCRSPYGNGNPRDCYWVCPKGRRY